MTQLQKSGGGRFFIIFNCFSGVKKFIRENKLKTDPAPEVGGGEIPTDTYSQNENSWQ